MARFSVISTKIKCPKTPDVLLLILFVGLVPF
jgi:hypothetical protein